MDRHVTLLKRIECTGAIPQTASPAESANLSGKSGREIIISPPKRSQTNQPKQDASLSFRVFVVSRSFISCCRYLPSCSAVYGRVCSISRIQRSRTTLASTENRKLHTGILALPQKKIKKTPINSSCWLVEKEKRACNVAYPSSCSHLQRQHPVQTEIDSDLFVDSALLVCRLSPAQLYSQ